MTETKKQSKVFTVGHSTHALEDFVSLLEQHGVDAIADVRSVPYSRWQPQFNREDLAEALKARNIAYVFLGKELGARSDDPRCYENSRVQYRALAETPLFQSGIKRVRDGSKSRCLALMCAEKDPLDCHRTVLVARELLASGVDVTHILENGSLEPHDETIRRLFEQLRLPTQDLFLTPEELEGRAYAAQERRIAYVDEEAAQ